MTEISGYERYVTDTTSTDDHLEHDTTSTDDHLEHDTTSTDDHLEHDIPEDIRNKLISINKRFISRDRNSMPTGYIKKSTNVSPYIEEKNEEKNILDHIDNYNVDGGDEDSGLVVEVEKSTVSDDEYSLNNTEDDLVEGMGSLTHTVGGALKKYLPEDLTIGGDDSYHQYFTF